MISVGNIKIVPNRTIGVEELYAPSILVPWTPAAKHRLEILVGQERLTQYMKEQKQLRIVRTICRYVEEQMPLSEVVFQSSLQDRSLIDRQKSAIRSNLPVACAIGRFGIGNCGELCRTQVVEKMQRSWCCIGELICTGENNFEEGHAFNVEGLPDSNLDLLMGLKSCPIDMMIALLNPINEARLADPLLQCECPLSEYTASPTGRYNRIIGASRAELMVLEGGPEIARVIVAKADEIFKKAQEIFREKEPQDSFVWDLPCMQELQNSSY